MGTNKLHHWWHKATGWPCYLKCTDDDMGEVCWGQMSHTHMPTHVYLRRWNETPCGSSSPWQQRWGQSQLSPAFPRPVNARWLWARAGYSGNRQPLNPFTSERVGEVRVTHPILGSRVDSSSVHMIFSRSISKILKQWHHHDITQPSRSALWWHHQRSPRIFFFLKKAVFTDNTRCHPTTSACTLG